MVQFSLLLVLILTIKFFILRHDFYIKNRKHDLNDLIPCYNFMFYVYMLMYIMNMLVIFSSNINFFEINDISLRRQA